jgi:hypothetical protein
LALVKAKQDEHITSLDVDDKQDKFETIIKKWNKISMQVMNVECSNQLKNGVACKDKWGSLVGDFKKICDYKASIKNNQDYWSMTNVEKSTIRLPWNFG